MLKKQRMLDRASRRRQDLSTTATAEGFSQAVRSHARAHGPDGVFDAANVEQLFSALKGLELQQAVA